MAPSVGVFIDYQNVHMSAHEQFCAWGESPDRCVLDPLRLAEVVVGKRAGGGSLTHVWVYRGRPDPRKQARLTAANDKQFQAWLHDPRVNIKRRPLRYPRDYGQPGCVEAPREKGIDVSLAIDLVRAGLDKRYDAIVLMSRDTDLMPAVEMVFSLPGAHIEVATWDGATRLRSSGGRSLWCHMLTEDDWRACRDRRPY